LIKVFFLVYIKKHLIMENNDSLILQYIEQMTPNEKKVYKIASESLKSSFDIEKSIGFIKFKQQHKIEK